MIQDVRHGFALLAADLLYLLGVVSLMAFVNPSVAIVVALGLGVGYTILTERTEFLSTMGLAALIAFGWVLIGNGQYGYNFAETTLLGWHIFPFLAWTAALYLMTLIYSDLLLIAGTGRIWWHMTLFLGVMWPLIIIVETLSYHLSNVKNIATAQYPGLPLCDCMHAPFWMQVAYFSIPVVYFLCLYVVQHWDIRKILPERHH